MKNEFLLDEKRCGFLVKTQLKKIWAVEIDLLNELIRVCKKYDIKVYAYAGTLLGAIRHNGFIPWDDDLDVCLERTEYEKLIKIAPHEFTYPYFLQTERNDRKFFCGYARFRNSDTTGIIEWTKDENYNNGIYIDVFVLDGYIENKILFKKQIFRKKMLNRMLSMYYCDRFESGIRGFLNKVIKRLSNTFFSYDFLLDKYDETLKKYNKKTKRRSIMTHSIDMINRYWCNMNDLIDGETAQFEYTTIPIPQNANRILKNTYGNYLEYPPIEKRTYNYHSMVVTFDPDISYKEYFRRHHNKDVDNHDE